jgi:LPXTG-motif cell wall-anchored protein
VVAPSPASAANSPDVHTLFAADAVPATPAFNDAKAVEAGVKFAPTVDGTILGLRFYQGPGNTGSHTGLIAGAGLLLAGIGAVLFVVYRRRSVKFTA